MCKDLDSVPLVNETAAPKRWTSEEAQRWQAKQPWVVGCNFYPSTAINQLEMWQAESFDLRTIDRELGWAASIGMNAVRVYLHDLAYEPDPQGFLDRMEQFLRAAHSHGIRPLFVIFDDCWDPEPKPGKQPEPKPGVHNSGWVQSPGKAQRNWPQDFCRLEAYVTDVLETFKDDPRIYGWDLYNEPGGADRAVESLVLLKKTFEWAWSVRPSQPLTAGIWFENETLNNFQWENSDVISFHNYEPVENLLENIALNKKPGRPLICTEWMARSRGSRVETHLSVFKKENVACFNWGLVSGKSNTIFPWGSELNAPQPDPWFHDLFKQDGTPYCEAEVAHFRELTGRGATLTLR